MRGLLQDLRFAVRSLRKRPGVTLVAVLTLALGIGANTVVFGVTNAVLLRPLPFSEPDRLVMLWAANPRLQLGFDDLPISQGEFRSWREQSRTVESMSVVAAGHSNLSRSGEPERVGGASVSASFFRVTGVWPERGRAFSETDDRPGAARVVVISHRLWRQKLGGDPNVVGRAIMLDGEPHTIVGIMPAGFAYPGANDLPAYTGAAEHSDFWRPAAVGDDRSNRTLAVLGRLAPGQAPGQAQAEFDVIASGLAAAYPDTNEGFGVRVRPLDDQVIGDVRPAIAILQAAVALVLLVACANLANLMLARASARRREIAVRVAIGAGRWHIVRQLLAESLVLSLTGGAAGALLSVWGVQAVRAFGPRAVPRLDEASVDATALAFTLGVSLATAVLFGLAPAIRAARVDLREALKDGAHPASGASRTGRARGAVVVAQVALLTVLLASAGLVIRSFVRLTSVDPGFEPAGVLAATVPLPASKYGEPERAAAFFREAVDEIGALPGVRSAAVVSQLPLSGSVYAGGFSVRERPDLDTAEDLVANRRMIGPAYFETMRIPVVAGRGFADTDTSSAPGVAVVSDAFARRYLPDGAIGAHVKLGGPDSSRPWLEVVGVAGDVRDAALEKDAAPSIYVPFEQMPFQTMTIVVRADADPGLLGPSVRREIRELDADQPVNDVRTLDRYVSDAVARPRFAVLLLGGFAVAALVLAAVGLSGVVAYSVARRTHEIGVRMALGARPGDALRLVLGQGMRLAAIGTAIGLVAAYAATRLLSAILFQVSPADPLTFVATPAVLAVVALAACYLPARRATRVDPAVALRSE